MKDYQHFTAAEFAEIKEFILWVKHPTENPQIKVFWEDWMAKNPHKREEIQEARDMILALTQDGEEDTMDVQQAVWARIQHSSGQHNPAQQQTFKRARWAKMTVSFFLLAALSSAAIWWIKDTEKSALVSDEIEFFKEINNGKSPKKIILGDGSAVTLQPKSYLQYPVVFSDNIREIKLHGEAFFDIAKQSNRPFVVYSDQLVTRVTGTSFTVRDFEGDKDVFVQVKTGQVSVFTKRDVQDNQQKGDQQLEGVLLTPNQQVSFSAEQARLVKSLVDNPSLLVNYQQEDFEFKNEKLTKVFELMENAYGVEIIYDDELMGDCQLNASLKGMTLYDKMRLICKGINASYEILDSKIIVQGSGCK